MKIKEAKKIGFYAVSVAFWLFLWQLASVLVGRELFLPSPVRVIKVLFSELIYQKSFWTSTAASLIHIGEGFLLGTALGILLAVFSYCFKAAKVLLWFPMKVIKSVPVASFVILSLLWLRSENLSVFIPFLMVLPTLYVNTMTGLEKTDKKLLEMAALFKLSHLKKALHIYLPHILSYILSACSLAIGMAWKSGIAAEIIGLAGNSIGNQLYQAKLYLMTPELFAWTIVIVFLSILCEQLIHGLALLLTKLESMNLENRAKQAQTQINRTKGAKT